MEECDLLMKLFSDPATNLYAYSQLGNNPQYPYNRLDMIIL